MKKIFSIGKWCAGLFLVASIITGCGKDDAIDPDPDPVPVPVPVPDPAGTQTLQMFQNVTINNAVYITYANDFAGGAQMTRFLKVGKVNGLGDLTSIPTSGWEYSIPVEPECGYIAYCKGVYYRFYVVKYLYEDEQVCGAEVKYQFPFEPTTLELSEEALSYGVRGENYFAVNITTNAINWTYSCRDPWIKAGNNDQQLVIAVTENKTTIGRHGEVFVHANERTKRIVITQDSIHQTSAPYSVGDIYFEKGIRGVVFKVTDGGWQGLIVSPDEGQYTWGQGGVDVGCLDASNGMNNMEKVKQKVQWEQRYPAFKWCDGLNTGGITGWYLPAINELKDLYAAYNGTPVDEEEPGTIPGTITVNSEAREKFNETLVENGGIALGTKKPASWRDDSYYWSSTEERSTWSSSQEFLGAATVNFSIGRKEVPYSKSENFCVRAVRPF
jgi:hypothetical protein